MNESFKGVDFYGVEEFLSFLLHKVVLEEHVAVAADRRERRAQLM